MEGKKSKRLFDIVVVLSSAIIVLPIVLLLVILVRLLIGRPILFKQKRPGRHGKPFMMYKFRTMKNIYDINGKLLPDAQRMTKFGTFLRKSSLDELPELLNILKGDMSLVGPRPLLMEYLPRYTKKQARRHETKPGITGWAQVSGRNSLNWPDKFKLDVWYVDHQSFLLDLKILLRTVRKVLRPEGINQEGCATMTEFMGNDN